MTLKCIVAVDKNFGIGFNNSIPWPKFPEDLKRFKELTVGNGNNAVVMGRKTFESIGKTLNSRSNILCSKGKLWELNDAGEKWKYPVELYDYDVDDVWIIGGQQIYELFEPHIEEIYLTYICAEFPADKYFTLLQKGKWLLLDEDGNEAHLGVNAKKSKAGFCYQFLRAIRV